ncbi:MAG: metallophosphoesterase, partial [Armatimonadetes bacterium]|nr:metallophosphoesterase [Armatimonadota bacterium]
MPNTRTIARVAGGGSLFAALLYVWAQHVEPFALELTEPEIICPRLPEAWDGVRVLFLTDPHVEIWARREDLLLRMLNDIKPKPDLLLWGGDYFFRRKDAQAGLILVRAVQTLFPDMPTFGVLGNAEHKITPTQTAQFVHDLETIGVRVLNNRHEDVTLRGETVTMAGVDDPYYGYDDLTIALQGANRDRF